MSFWEWTRFAKIPYTKAVYDKFIDCLHKIMQTFLSSGAAHYTVQKAYFDLWLILATNKSGVLFIATSPDAVDWGRQL